MLYSREEHYLFLEEELRAETEQFKQKLDMSASYLLNEREELFIAQFVKIEDGEMILKFSNSRGLPRKGEYLYCFTTPKHLHQYKEWGKISYGDLIRAKGVATEVVCIWQSPIHNDSKFCLVGFRGVDVDFAEHLLGHTGAFLILGPNVPPYQYISNLQSIVKHCRQTCVATLLEGSIEEQGVGHQPISLPNINVSDFIIGQLNLSDSIIIQGPPGTGKTYQIASVCRKLCEQGNSVLVTALTNRALMEIAAKEELQALLQEGRIFKTKLSVDEAKELPKLCSVKHIAAEPGNIMLSTFYIASGEAREVRFEAPFDYVIMDEASQALLGMFVAAKLLGKKCIVIGDTNQLPPVIAISKDRIARRNYHLYVEGLASIEQISNSPTYRLIETYRLPQRAAEFTGLFYEGTLKSKVAHSHFVYSNIPAPFNVLFNPLGGPALLKTELPQENKKPIPAMLLAAMLVSALFNQEEKVNVAVLTFYVDTAKALQKTIFQIVGAHNNLLVDTVARIQGLTTDVVIYVIPNTIYTFTLNRRVFNVATSRARRHTIIISDVGIMCSLSSIDADVAKYLSALDKASLYVPITNTTQTLDI